jgi:DNA-binding FrmR family transcriptional regulator
MQKSTKASCQKHLSTIRDEVCNLSRMVDEDRYGIDIVKQISAVCDGLQRVGGELLRDRVARCVDMQSSPVTRQISVSRSRS